MKRPIILLILLAAVAGGCKNKPKKISFDYTTLPANWTMLTTPDDDSRGYLVSEDVLTIERDNLSINYFSTGEALDLKILRSYLVGDTILMDVKQGDYGSESNVKLVWVNKDHGVARWIFDEGYSETCISNDKLSAFQKINHDGKGIEPADTKTKAENPEELVPGDQTVFEKIIGDLNHDGREDCVIITKETDEEAFVVDEYDGRVLDRNRRGILIAFNKGGYYETALAKESCFSSENEDGGVYFAPELGIDIEKNNLKIHYSHGRYGWWQYIFRYRNNRFELIGYDEFNNRGPVTENSVSVNFLTKKEQTLKNTNHDAEGGDEVFDETWKDIVLPNGLVKLSEIISFDAFDVSRTYTEKTDAAPDVTEE
jgi:hypothetical protein